MSTTCQHLWATAATLEDIKTSIQKFYSANSITLTSTGPKEWSIANSIRTIPNTRVILKGKRYRFESTTTA
jgi:hypothetical protein